jgi:acetoin utilization deacetylase AcuC-like enzyme
LYARIKYGFRRFAIVDIDAHFGNGTAEICQSDPHAFYASVHLQCDHPHEAFFPSAPCCRLGYDSITPNYVSVNVYPSIKAGSILSKLKRLRGREGFRSALELKVLPPLEAFKPDIIFISAGFDGVESDPIGGRLGLNPSDFHWMTSLIQDVADRVCFGRVVSVLEGGYDVTKTTDGLSVSAQAHVLAMAGRSMKL